MNDSLQFDDVRLRPLTLVTGFLLLTLSGCGHHHEKEDHHLEHFIPAHKPETFAESVSQLGARGPAVLAGEATKESRQQLLDIIDWLPELAGDSDLKRPQWEQVRDSSIELRQIVTIPSEDTSQPRWIELVEQLGSLIPDSETMIRHLRTENDSTSNLHNEDPSTPHSTEEVHHD